MSDAFTRVPPNSVEAEQAVIGGLMLSPEKIETVAERLAQSDFYRRDHQLIYRAMLELSGRGQPCDAITLGEWFTRNDFDWIESAYLMELANNTPSSANVAAYSQIVREKAVRRSLIDLATSLSVDAYASDSEAPALLDGAIAGLMSMQKVESRAEFTLRQAMTLAYQEAERAKALGGKVPGISTGLSRLDKVLGGWHDSDLVIVGARPAMGKTALLLNFALSAGVPCGIISAEQPAQQVAARVMSIDSHVPAERMRNGSFDTDDLRRLDLSVGRLIERTCLIYDRSAPSIADVSRMARKWKQQNGIKILLVDYVQRIEASNADKRTPKHERVGEVVRGLKNLARDLDIPVVALAQVGRHVDTREDKQPGMGDISDSSEIEKEADQIITLYRPGVHDDTADQAEAILSVEKNRHGPTGVVRAAWLAETMRFVDLAHDNR
jgi:replicative DNA helicase